VTLTAQERQDCIQRYADGPALLRRALERLPQDAVRWRPAAGKWSAHEVIVHCADSETNAAIRIRYLIGEKQPTIVGYDQDAWAEILDYQAHPLDAALATVVAVRANTVPLLRRLPESAWSRSGTHTEVGAYSADSWLKTYAEHLETHTRQIERNLAAWQAKSGS
jgi:hypothetical protein